MRRKRFQGKTASLTEIPRATPSPLDGSKASSRNCAMEVPSAKRAAAFARATPVALLTKGTVREARGLASRTNN